MRSSGSVICSRDRRFCVFSLSLILSAALFSGCPKDSALVSLPAPLERHLVERGDPLLRKALLLDSPMPFAVIARFKSPIFPYQSELLADAGIPPVESTGNTALLLTTAKEITGLFDTPSLLAIYFLGSQASLARIHPELEIELVRKFDQRKESDLIRLLVRFRSAPEKRESDAIAAAGFRIESQTGSYWEIQGPIDHFHGLLTLDEITYLEDASKPRGSQ